MYGTKEIPSVGKLEFSWHHAATNATTKPGANIGDGDIDMGGTSTIGDAGTEKGQPEVDYDVAEEDDRWN